MKLKILVIISDSDKKIVKFINMFNLPFNTISSASGTASQSILDFFGLKATEKFVSFSIYPDYLEDELYKKLDNKLHLDEIGNGIAFSIPLSSSSKYVALAFENKKEGEKMTSKNNIDYHLILTIVQEGYADKVMSAAKKCGANGGTIINARAIGDKNSFKFFNITMEPEKDIVLIVCHNGPKNKIMDAIVNKSGIKTEAKGMCISLPIDNLIGINQDVE